MPISLVHPCDKEDNGGCQQKCEKDGDVGKCACQEGFKLAGDGKNCEKGLFNHYLLLLVL